jgi:hypothetical protein
VEPKRCDHGRSRLRYSTSNRSSSVLAGSDMRSVVGRLCVHCPASSGENGTPTFRCAGCAGCIRRRMLSPIGSTWTCCEHRGVVPRDYRVRRGGRVRSADSMVGTTVRRGVHRFYRAPDESVKARVTGYEDGTASLSLAHACARARSLSDSRRVDAHVDGSRFERASFQSNGLLPGARQLMLRYHRLGSHLRADPG